MPTLFYQSPESLYKKVVENAENLGISLKEYIKIALKTPNLFYQLPSTIEKNVIEKSEKLGKTKDELVSLGLKDSKLLVMKAETIDSNIESLFNLYTNIYGIKISKKN